MTEKLLDTVLKLKQSLIRLIFRKLDSFYRSIDRTHIRRTRNIRLIPDFRNRRGGKTSYAEWAHVIGIFQTLIYQSVNQKTGCRILDIGCGTGLIGIASEPFTTDGGMYTGIDVMSDDISFCRSHYTSDAYHFLHLDYFNSAYERSQSHELKPWPVEDESSDLVVALSVWTHLNEKDALYYFSEIHRVLKKEGKAIITFFYLDEHYTNTLNKRRNSIGRFHSTNQNEWIFDRNAHDSTDWFTPNWTQNPEEAIGVSKVGLTSLLSHSSLKVDQYYPGNWKEIPGVFFQDVLIFSKR